MTIPLFVGQTSADLITVRFNTLINEINAAISAAGGGGTAAPSLFVRSAITTSTALPVTFIVSGFVTPGDGGSGATYTSQGAGAGSLMAIQSQDGVWFRLVTNGTADIGWFGAIGDGVADDSAAFVKGLAWLAIRRTLILSATSYKISQKLILPDTDFWAIVSTCNSIITQATTNTGIFEITPTSERRGFQIKNIQFTWATLQTAADTNSVAIGFKSIQVPQVGGCFNFTISDVVITRGFRGIAFTQDSIDGGFTIPVWGFKLEFILSFFLPGATIYLGGLGGSGAPRAFLTNIYSQNSITQVEPALILQQMDSVTMNGIEFNLGYNTQMMLTGVFNVFITGLRVEATRQTTPNQAGAIIIIAGTRTFCTIDGFYVHNHFVDVGAGQVAYFLYSNNAYVSLKNLHTDIINFVSGSPIITLTDGAIGFMRMENVPIYVTPITMVLFNNNDTGLFQGKRFSYGRPEEKIFWKDAVPIGAGPANLAFGSAVTTMTMAHTGWIGDILASVDVPIVAGTITVTVSINGLIVSTWLTVVLNSTNQSIRSYAAYGRRASPNSQDFDVGDVISVAFTSSGALDTNTKNLQVVLTLAYD